MHLSRPVVLLCRRGVRAEQATQRLAGAGLANLHVLEGGLTFSALSNSCAMGAVLARLAFNRGPVAPTRRDVLAQLTTTSAVSSAA